MPSEMVCQVALVRKGRDVGRARRVLKAASIRSISWPSHFVPLTVPFWGAGPYPICVSQEDVSAAKELLRNAGFTVDE